jgi:hypothetical protein
MSTEPMVVPFRGKISKMLKPECQRLALYLNLDASGTLSVLRPRLQEHLNNHTGILAGDPVLSGLFYSTASTDKARKTSTDKDMEDSAIGRAAAMPDTR